MPSNFDPIEYANDLDAARVPRDQAGAHVKALTKLRADVAFAADLVKLEGNLRQEIRGSEERLGVRIEQVHTDLNAKIDAVRTELTDKIEALRFEMNTKIEALRLEMNAKIEALRFEMNARIDTLRADLTAKIETVEAKMEALRTELILHRWIFGVLISLCSANLALTVKILMQ